ncbi:MmgE/PrpD family protein [Alcaligenaceae bacterium CGII-47]|nr:MmgE/PrpD family protein [Alcaligenaceae bacterium CGII-47]
MVHDPQALVHFALHLRYRDLPPIVVAHAKRCILDLCGVAAAGVGTDLSHIIRDHAARHFGAGDDNGARMLFDGRRVSLPGAALAGGMTIDSMDAHDGHVLTKGHVGVTVLPVLLALADSGILTNEHEFLTALVLGYEVATRAGIALHASACDYHTSGAWNALAAAVLSARALGLDPLKTREALGIAEYHGPRSQMMRCIDHPTMVKDGSGWGAMAGLSAALLAQDGFTGAPAITVEDEGLAPIWADLGTRWCILEQYFKPYPVCRWAQPAVEAALLLIRTHAPLNPEDIHIVRVTSFHQACRLATREPDTTEQAQYSLPFSVGMTLAKGQLGAAEVKTDALRNVTARRLSNSMELRESELFNSRFPAQRWAEVEIEMRDGQLLRSGPITTRGDPETPLSDEELLAKFSALTHPVIGVERASAIRDSIDGLGHREGALRRLLNSVLEYGET